MVSVISAATLFEDKLSRTRKKVYGDSASSETVRRQLALALLLFKLNPFPIKKIQNYHQVSHQA